MRYQNTGSAALPITLDHVKEWLGVYHDEDDDLITGMLSAAFDFSEGYTGCSFHTQSWVLTLSAREAAGGFDIFKNPISKFNGITVTDSKGNIEQLKQDDFMITTLETVSLVVITNPNILINASIAPDAISVSFDSDAGLPFNVESAIKMMCAWQYENRGDAPSVNNNSAPPEALKFLQLERVAFV